MNVGSENRKPEWCFTELMVRPKRVKKRTTNEHE